MNLQRESSLELYQAYQQLDADAYRERVRLYDEHRHLLEGLSEPDRMMLTLDYHQALFEIGKYQRFLDGIDPLIEYVIIENVGGYSNDLFCELLFKKAASLYNLWQLPKCEGIVRQVLSIQQDYPEAQALMYQCRLRSKRRWYQVAKAISVVAFFSGAVGLLFTSLVVAPFYPDVFSLSQGLSIGLLATCVLGLVGNEVAVKVAALLEVKQHASR